MDSSKKEAMRKTIFAIILFVGLIFSSNNAFADTSSDIKAHCQQKWATDYKMQQYCIEKMNDGMQGL